MSAPSAALSVYSLSLNEDMQGFIVIIMAPFVDSYTSVEDVAGLLHVIH